MDRVIACRSSYVRRQSFGMPVFQFLEFDVHTYRHPLLDILCYLPGSPLMLRRRHLEQVLAWLMYDLCLVHA